MSSAAYERYREPKSCFVPTCNNTDIKKPNLRFFTIRRDLKHSWCELLSRNCTRRSLYCCEDHLNLEEDLENYDKYVCGAKPRLKLTAIPKNIPKIVDDIAPENPTSGAFENATSSLCSIAMDIVAPNSNLSVHDIAPENSTSEAVENATSSLCSSSMDIVSPFNNVDHTAPENSTSEAVENCSSAMDIVAPNTNVDTDVEHASIKREFDMDFEIHKINDNMKIMPSIQSQLPKTEESPCQSASLSCLSNFEPTTSSHDQKLGRNHLLKTIKNYPKMYLGLSKNFWWTIDFISKQYSCPALHIIMTLFKIKTNDTFVRMSHEFEMAKSTVRIIFEINVFVLAAFFKNLIFLPSLIQIYRKLPIAFRKRYSNVHIIMDYLEIRIKKPSDQVKQAQTWSQHESCYTVKYLIGCTPAGFISFISKGYGGGTSDETIFQKSGFIDILPANAVVMARTKNVEPLRFSRFLAKINLVKNEAIETPVTTRLRVDIIQRVRRKIQELNMLKLGTIVNHEHLVYLDEVVLIACGLVNLQGPIIKES